MQCSTAAAGRAVTKHREVVGPDGSRVDSPEMQDAIQRAPERGSSLAQQPPQIGSGTRIDREGILVQAGKAVPFVSDADRVPCLTQGLRSLYGQAAPIRKQQPTARLSWRDLHGQCGLHESRGARDDHRVETERSRALERL